VPKGGFVMLKPEVAIVAPASASLAELAKDINAAHLKAVHAVRASLKHACRVGDLLCAAKQKVGHGHWLAWLSQNVRFSERTAQDYMRLHHWRGSFESNPQFAADLTIREALSLLTSEKSEGAPGGQSGPPSSPETASPPDPGTEERIMPYVAPGPTPVPKAISSLAEAGFLDLESVDVLLKVRNDYGDEVVRTWPPEIFNPPLTDEHIWPVLNSYRPLDQPTLWPILKFLDSPAEEAVKKAFLVWVNDARCRGTIPHWELTAFWYAAQAVRLTARLPSPLTAAQLAKHVSTWRKHFRTALAWFVTDGFGEYKDLPDQEADPEGAEMWWLYRSDLRHAGVAEEAEALRAAYRLGSDAWKAARSRYPGLWASCRAGILDNEASEESYLLPSGMQGRLDRRTNGSSTDVSQDEARPAETGEQHTLSPQTDSSAATGQ
jgi:hypothetical protein